MSAPLEIAVATSTRAEYGILRPVLTAMAEDDAFAPRLMAFGAHLSEAFGKTIDAVEAEALAPVEKLETLAAGDDATAAAETSARTITAFAQSFGNSRPDMVLITGDRPEMLAVATAATLCGVPIAHLHGGELTFGAVDDAIRHALTKMSHLHFSATEEYAARIHQMGEDPDRVFVTGAPGLDNLKTIALLSDDALAKTVGLKMAPAPLLCTFHPLTIGAEQTMAQLSAMLDAIERTGLPAIFTYPGADPQSGKIIDRIEQFAAGAENRITAANLGTDAYFSLMSRAAAMVGNSSSGIIEAASFALPVVNIGARQAGRVRAANVIDVAGDAGAVEAGIKQATDPAFRNSLNGLINPYGDGKAAPRILAALKGAPPREELLMKIFRDMPHAR